MIVLLTFLVSVTTSLSSLQLQDTLLVHSSVGVPANKSIIYKPDTSKSAVQNDTLVLDVAGDFVLNGNPNPLLWQSWDFSSPFTILHDSFSNGNPCHSDTRFDQWEVLQESSETCKVLESGGRLQLQQSAPGSSDCGVCTTEPVIKPFRMGHHLRFFNLSLASESSVLRLFLTVPSGAALIKGKSMDSARSAIGLELDGTQLQVWSVSEKGNTTILGKQNWAGSGCTANAIQEVEFQMDIMQFSYTIHCPQNNLKNTLDHKLNWKTWAPTSGSHLQLCLTALGGTVALEQAHAESLATDRWDVEAALLPIPNTVGGLMPGDSPALGASQAELLPWGILDVTQPPFSADHTGKLDSTAALQRAFNYSRAHSLQSYLPAGVYLVSDTLEMLQASRLDALSGKPGWKGARWVPNYVMGNSKAQSQAERSTIVLAAHSPGFGNVKSPKYVVRMWYMNSGRKTQTNAHCNQVLRSVDIRISEGNPGAVGVMARGAQGTVLQDVNVYAGDALVGIAGGSGSGGSHYNVTVVGGKYGFDDVGSQPGPTLTGVNLINQTCIALLHGGLQTLSISGLVIQTASNGQNLPAIVTGCPPPTPSSGDCAYPYHYDPVTNGAQDCETALSGPLSLVDSVINHSGGGSAVIHSSRSLFMQNVFFFGHEKLVYFPDNTTLVAKDKSWNRVVRYAHGIASGKVPNGSGKPKISLSSPAYVNGKKNAGATYNEGVHNGTSPPATLQSQHLYGGAAYMLLPSWQDPQAINAVRDYGAAGDGVMDDFKALSAAISAAASGGRPLFLPRGVYRVSQTLSVPEGTWMSGLGLHLTAIVPTGDKFEGKAVLRTESAGLSELSARRSQAEGMPGTVVSDLSVITWLHYSDVSAIHWKAGPSSVFFHNHVDRKKECGSSNDNPLPELALSPSPHAFTYPVCPPCRADVKMIVPLMLVEGAGSFYNFYNEDAMGPTNVQDPTKYRHLLVQNTKGPLNFYHLNPEHTLSDADSEFLNSSNILVMGVKSEGDYPPIWVNDCSNFTLSGAGGNAQPPQQYPEGRRQYPPSLYRMLSCKDNCLLANLWGYHDGKNMNKYWNAVYNPGGQGAELSGPDERPVLWLVKK